ncbi:Fasciclin-like arabinogalactan protein 6 [Striga hermonthica]|uniref:Fasciclin-like arabinogalactan protein 6 n=1 Tax=Striga hermonthica TaxID=68872 RepID=A0A9N7MU69_STRHE|nr:Fasciclin-like arabinogalactan protein 6 [Striga hermonthica]
MAAALHLLLPLLLLSSASAQTAPAPSHSTAPVNITGILDRAGGYTSFIRLLNETQAAVQINSQANNSHDGMTVFAPTDNAFTNLPAGALNNLTTQQQVQLVLYHICPKFYTLDDLRTVSNPVRTQASGQDGGVFGLYVSGGVGSGVNISTGIVSVPIYNAVRGEFPLAVYQVDRVLLPREFYEASPPAAAPPANGTRARGGGGGGGGGDSVAPSSGNPSGNGCGKISVGMGLLGGIWLLGVTLF